MNHFRRQPLAHLLLRHQEGLLNYCHVPLRFGVVEAVNGNIKPLLRRGRGYTNLRYLLMEAQRLAALKTESLILREAASIAMFFIFSFKAIFHKHLRQHVSR